MNLGGQGMSEVNCGACGAPMASLWPAPEICDRCLEAANTCDQCGLPLTRRPEKDSPIMWPGADRFRCKTCDEVVTEGPVALREHLEGHHGGAAAFEAEQVRECFEFVGQGPEVAEGVYEAYECPNGHVLLEPFD